MAQQPIEDVFDAQQVQAKTTPDEVSEIGVPDEVPDGDHVVYFLQGQHTQDLEVLPDAEASTGLLVPAHYAGQIGPFRAGSGTRPRFLKATQQNEAVTVRVYRGSVLRSSSYISGPQATRPGTDLLAKVTGATTQASWAAVTSLSLASRGQARRLREVKPYIKDTSGGGNQTDWDLLEALDPDHTVGDLPAGLPADGDGWRRVDSGTLTIGGDGPVIGAGYAVRSHLVVLRAQQNGGPETVTGVLSADEEGT